MLALSVQQPWPWLIFYGAKDIENRTWAPPPGLVGQRFAIHASKRRQPLEPLDIMADVMGWGVEEFWEPKIPQLAELPLGVLLGTVRLAGVTRDGRVGDRKSKWFSGPFGWMIPDPKPLAEPIPCRGSLGLWEVQPSAVPLLEAA